MKTKTKSEVKERSELEKPYRRSQVKEFLFDVVGLDKYQIDGVLRDRRKLAEMLLDLR